MSETPETGVEETVADAPMKVEQVSATAASKTGEVATDAAETAEQATGKPTGRIEQAAGFGQENLEAIVESSRAVAKAAEAINAEILAFSKKSYEDGIAAAQELGGSKSVTEFVEKQAAFNRRMMDAFMAEAAKMNEIYTDAARSCLEPLSARVQATMEKARSPRA